MIRYAFAFLLLFTSIVLGQSILPGFPPGVFKSRGAIDATSGGGFTPSCAQSATFLTAATGVTAPADKLNYDTMICGVATDFGGTLPFDVWYIWAALTQTNASLINIANPGTFNGTITGTVNFTPYQGYTGDGSTFFINSGFNPSTATTPNYVRNSANVGVYVLNARVTGTILWDIGCTAAGCDTAPGPFFSPYSAGSFSAQLNSPSGLSGAPASSQGSWNLTRTTSSHQSIFLNSSEIEAGGNNDTSAAVENGNIIFFALVPGFGWTSDQMAAGWIGKGLSNVDSCKVNNRINTYMLSLTVPKNIYSNSAC